jgi:TolB protein
VAFVSPRTGDDDIYLLEPPTGQVANLTAHLAEDRDPAWSPDGTSLAFASHRDGNWEMYLWSAVDGSITRLTTDPAYDGAPAWSPDGARLAFESYRDGNLEIYLLALATGSAPVRLTNNRAGDYAPAWSPDGRYVAFTSWRDGDKEIYLADLEDGTVRNLTNYPAADDETPAWSPDGTTIAFVSWRDGDAELYTMRPNGSEQRPVTANDVYDGAPAWFPDGQQIIYTGYQEGEPFEVYDPYRPGTYRLFTAPVDGAPPRHGTDLLEQAFPADATDPTVASSLPWADLTRHLPSPPSTSTPTPTLPPGELHPLVALEDIAVADPRLNAAVAGSYRAWREEVHQKTGWDYLGQLSDVLREPGYISRKHYGYLTWHKTGRAADLRFELPDEEGRDQLLVVRDDVGQRTYWRLFIRCRAQDGTQGRPLTDRPWVFWFVLDKEKEPEAYEAGGRPTSIPSGYYEDFTAIARRHGWQRIPAFEEEDYDWRWDSLGLEYWHYQRPDGLTWYQAMQQVYPEETLQEFFNWPLCLERGQTEEVLQAKGVPTPTPTNTPTHTPTPTGMATPTVPSQANITDISDRPQTLPLDCESRSAVDWAAYFGVQIDELEFFHRLPLSDNPDKGFVGDVHGSWGQIPPKPYGVHAEPVAAVLRNYGLDAQAVRDFSLDALRSEIASGQPVITWVTGQVAWGTPVPYTASDGSRVIVARYEHTVMVIGYNKREVSILDGAEVYTRQWSDFERSWAVLGNMAVIMHPHRPRLHLYQDEQHAGYEESF